jgi:hypothetical protein
MNEALPELDGKIVYLYVTGLSKGFDDGITLESVQLRTVGGRQFLVGRTLERYRPEWISGPETAVAWDAVASYLTYPSREAFVAAMERATQSGRTEAGGLLARIFGGKPA